MNVFRICLIILLVLPGTLTINAQDIFEAGVLKIHIQFEEEHWRDTLLEARLAGDNRRLDALVRINDSDYSGVQVRFKGNSSFYGAVKAGYKKMPFNLKAKDEYPFAGGYETLKLANNFRDPSAVREMLGYAIAGDYVPVPNCTYAVVYVNDEYLGVYTATEGISKSMAVRYFRGHKDGLIQAEPDFQRVDPPDCPKASYSSLEYLGEDVRCYEGLYEIRDEREWTDLIRLTRMLRDSTARVDEVLDVHLTLWMHVLNNVLVNLDSYLGYFCHNYYLFRDSSDIYHPLIWDLNLAFGGFHVLKQGAQVDFATLSPIVHDRFDLQNRPLIMKLLREPRFRHLYFSMMRTVVDDWLLTGKYLQEAKAFQASIRRFVAMEDSTFFTTDDFDQNLVVSVKARTRSVPGIQELMEARTQYLGQHPLLKPLRYSVDDWSVREVSHHTILEVNTLGDPSAVRVWYQGTPRAPFQSKKMTAEGNSPVFRCELPVKPFALYFELAGSEQANLWPKNAPHGALHVLEE
jgi:hypothetical protein